MKKRTLFIIIFLIIMGGNYSKIFASQTQVTNNIDISVIEQEIKNIKQNITELEKILSEEKQKLESLEKENVIVIKSLENNQNYITTIITVIGIVFASLSFIFVVLSFSSVWNYLQYRMEDLVSKKIKDRLEYIEKEARIEMIENMEEKFKNKFDYWDDKYTELYREAKDGGNK